MSVQRECAFIEVTDRGGWFLFLAREEYGELTAWSADCIGPFASEQATDRYLHDHFSNPGGMMVDENQTYAELPPALREMMARVQRPRRGW